MINALSRNCECTDFLTFLVFVQYTAKHFFHICVQITNFVLSTICCVLLSLCFCLIIKISAKFIFDALDYYITVIITELI